MAGDFSRKTFAPDKDFSLVRMQQGRLFADADWNEQGDILRASDRESAADVIGHAGFPEDDAGFALIPDAASGAIVIGPGTGYVGGVRHVAREPAVFDVSHAGGSGSSTRWRIENGPTLADGDLLATVADGLSGFVVVTAFAEASDGARTFRTTPPLGGAETRLFKPITLTRQPYGAGGSMPTDAGEYLAVLASTEIPVTALDDRAIRETAFDGPDTAIRDRTTWRVFLVSRSALTDLGYQPAELSCPALAGGLDPVIGNAARGALRARAEVASLSTGPCTLPPAAGYRSLDNRLYRVEIHNGGDGTAATWKWSSDNAIHRTRYTEVDAGVLVVESAGRDESTALKDGDWIEIRDQSSINGRRPGFFARIDEVVDRRVSLAEILDPVTLAPLTSGGQPDTARLPAAAFVTRWEGGKPAAVADALGTWVDLEHGVQVAFDAGALQSGDHWTVPARAVTGDVEWPRDPFTSAPMAKGPDGPRRDYAALAWLDLSAAGVWSVTDDCRPLFPPATHSKQFLYGGGDGQEAVPDPLAPATRVPVPEKLVAAVVRGHRPVEGETVRFEIAVGDGRFGNGLRVEDVTTAAEGTASVDWRLDATTFSQRVVARRLDAAGTPTHHPIVYNATLSRAAQTSYDPANTPEIAGTRTVQEAIEALVGLAQVGCTTYVIQAGQDWVSILEGLASGEDASICFARGEYRTSRTVRVKGCGHLRVSGAGPGTVALIGNRVEAVLAFEDCASVSVDGIEIAAPDGNKAIPDGANTHRLGALDIGHCPEVEVRGCLLRCGGGTSAQRTCLSVRGWSEALGSHRATRSVRVTGNTFSVGNLQDAVVVTDAIDVDVSGNRFAVRPRSGSIGIGAFLSDRVWLANATKSLVARPVKGSKVGVSGDHKTIAGKQWRMTFNSPVPQKDWDDLVSRNPPTDADVASEAAFERYSMGLLKSVSENPTMVPSFANHIDRVRTTFGAGGRLLDDPAARRTLLVASEPTLHRFDAATGSARAVMIEANGHVISFDSPFNQADWSRMLTRSGQASKVANADELLGLTYKLAREVLLKPGSRRRLGSVENWLKKLRDNGVSLGSQAVVCAGRTLENVRICDNQIREFQVGIRVAPSHHRKRNLSARSVTVCDNRMELLTQSASHYAGYGMMIGNVETLRVCGNDMRLSSKPNFVKYFAQGIRIWGFIGHQVLVSENRIEMATMGIRLNCVENRTSDDRDRLWVLRENLIRGPKGVIGHRVTPPWIPIDQNNFVRGDL